MIEGELREAIINLLQKKPYLDKGYLERLIPKEKYEECIIVHHEPQTSQEKEFEGFFREFGEFMQRKDPERYAALQRAIADSGLQ